jgi:hypothetical protein
MDVIERVPGLASKAARVTQHFRWVSDLRQSTRRARAGNSKMELALLGYQIGIISHERHERTWGLSLPGAFDS